MRRLSFFTGASQAPIRAALWLFFSYEWYLS